MGNSMEDTVEPRLSSENNSKGTQDNLRRNAIYVGQEFERLGINGPHEIRREDFLKWLED